MTMPGSGFEPLGNHRDAEFQDYAQPEQPQLDFIRNEQQEADPEDLHQRDADCVGERCFSALRIAVCGTQPLRDHRDPHEDVAEHPEREVRVVRICDARHASCEDERASHLDHTQYPVVPIIGAVGVGKPSEVHPGPPDGEERHGEAQESDAEVTFAFEAEQSFTRSSYGDHEDQVEEELEWCCGAVRFVGITAHHGRQDPGQIAREVLAGSRHGFPNHSFLWRIVALLAEKTSWRRIRARWRQRLGRL